MLTADQERAAIVSWLRDKETWKLIIIHPIEMTQRTSVMCASLRRAADIIENGNYDVAVNSDKMTLYVNLEKQ
jgi:hypothetical protein